jgi:hypothetical protein
LQHSLAPDDVAAVNHTIFFWIRTLFNQTLAYLPEVDLCPHATGNSLAVDVISTCIQQGVPASPCILELEGMDIPAE